MPAQGLPDEIAHWRADADEVLVLSTDVSTIVVEASEDGSALLLSERPPGVATLTARERDVMRCVEDGLSNTEIARMLWIQPTTVRKHLEHVFDRYWQANRRARGAGLGLPIAKAIIEAHGGRIWAESLPGRGATVSFTLRSVPDA